MSYKRFLSFAITLFLLTGCWQRPNLNLEVNLTKDKVQRGKELVQGFGACGSCHGINANPNSTLAGGRELVDNYGLLFAANLTPSISGIGNYNLSDFIDAIRLNKSKKTEFMSGYFHRGLKKASNDDLTAIYAYLQTLTPVKNDFNRREIKFWQRNTTGLFEERSEFNGYISEISDTNPKIYGKYLVDRVADCAGCHQEDEPLFSEPKYLAGGKILLKGDQQKITPALKSKYNFNLKNWQEADFLRYLKTGQTPAGQIVSTDYCPTNFYAMAPEKDLQAVAKYLAAIQ